MTHCKTKTKQGKSKQGTFWYQCEVCGMNGKGATDEEAKVEFRKSKPIPANKRQAAKQPTQIMIRPQTPEQLPEYINQHMADILSIVAPFIQAEKPAVTRMIKLNMKYIMQNKNPGFLKCWETQDGQQSIIDAMDKALAMGAILPDMGSMVPFGGVVEFIEAVEAIEFALTTGKSAPFKSILIEPVFKNDQFECYTDKETGNFIFAFKKLTLPRGEMKGEIVTATDHGGVIIGQLYDVDRLLEKAKTHSKSYKAYLLNVQAFEFAQSEGTIQTDVNGREYINKVVQDKNAGKYLQQDIDNFQAVETAGTLKGKKPRDYAEVEIPKKGGGTWTKKIYRSDIESPGTNTEIIYRDELSNPYDGADRPERLRVTAGKSFFKKYLKVRNSVAAMEELRTEESEGGDIDSMLDGAIDSAMDNLSVEDTEYEIILEDGPEEEASKEAEEEPEPEPKAEQKKADAESDKQDDLF